MNMQTRPWEELHQAVSETYTHLTFLPHKVFWWHTQISTASYYFKKNYDDDVAQICMDTLGKNIKEIYKKFKFSKDMVIAMHAKLVNDNSILCHICNSELGEDRMPDHCHLSGDCRGAAHEVCNLKYKVSKYFPVVFHNLIWLWLSPLY